MRTASKAGTGITGKPPSPDMFRLVISPLLLCNRAPRFDDAGLRPTATLDWLRLSVQDKFALSMPLGDMVSSGSTLIAADLNALRTRLESTRSRPNSVDAHSAFGKPEDEEAPKDLALPAVQLGQQIINRRAEVVRTQTKPPKRYTEGTLVAAMESIDKEIEDPRLKKVMQTKEKAGIGTDATRGATLEGLFKRGYFAKEGKNIVPTDRGQQLIAIVEQVVPHIEQGLLGIALVDLIEDGQATLDAALAQACMCGV